MYYICAVVWNFDEKSANPAKYIITNTVLVNGDVKIDGLGGCGGEGGATVSVSAGMKKKKAGGGGKKGDEKMDGEGAGMENTDAGGGALAVHVAVRFRQKVNA